MLRGMVAFLTFIFLSLGSIAAVGDSHVAFPGGFGSRPEHHGLTSGGRHYGFGRKKALYSNYINSMSPYLGGNNFPTSNYLSLASGYPGYSMGYWGSLYGGWGLCYKQPGLYSNYQYGPYNYGSSPYGYNPYSAGYSPYGYGSAPYGWPSSGSCYSLGITYNPCGNNYGLLYAVNPNQPRILGVSF